MPTIHPRSLVLPALLCAATATAQTGPPGISVTTALSGLNTPTAVRFARDGRVFVAEKMGRVLEFDNLLDTEPRVVIDLRTATHNYWDRGLLGLALDRDFPDQPYVYIAYTYDAGIGGAAPRWGVPDSNGDECEGPLAGGGATEPGGGCVVSGRVSRLTLAGATATERVLVEDWFQQYPSHSIGALQVDADGALYASGGDGASFAFVDFGQAPNPNYPDTGSPPDEGGSLRAQDWRTPGDPMGLNGSIIRVVPSTGEPAPGNPGFADYTLSDNARRLLAYGLRNPFRHALRPGANELWIGDVGMDRWEEIDVLPLAQGAGEPANFGWPCFEGTDPQGGFDAAGLPLCESLYASPPPALRPPRFRYGHVSASCAAHGSALSGIAFQTGDALGAAYRNALFFADYARNRIFVLRDADADGEPDVPAGGTCGVQDDPDALVFVDGTANGSVLAVDLVTGPGGDLYYVDVGNGTLQRVHASGNRAPSAALVLEGGSTQSGPPRTVMLNAANSVDPDAGDTLTYDWDLDGDGAFDDASGTGLVEAIADLSTNGTHRLGVRVTDAAGRSDEQRVRVFVGNTPPVPIIAHPTASAAAWRTGDSIALLGGGSDEEDGPLPGTALQWQVTLAHCTDETFVDCHDHPVTTINGTRGTVTTPSHSYPSFLRVRLKATDSGGAQATQELALLPAVTDLQLASQPAGLAIAFGSEAAQPAPFARRVIANSAFSVGAVTPQLLGGIEHRFRSWSDGGAATHIARIAAPGAATLTASFDRVASLAATIDDGRDTIVAGSATTYTIDVRNLGAGLATDARVQVALPAALADVAWTCEAEPGASCAAAGSGAIDDVASLPAGASLRYVVTASVAPAATGVLSAQASVSVADGWVELAPADDADSDTTTIVAEALFANGFED